jgi:hypothetical protein
MVVVGGQFNVAGQVLRQHRALHHQRGAGHHASIPAPERTTRCWRSDGRSTIRSSRAASFTHVNGNSYNHIVRFNADGSIDTTNFFVGTGADDVVYNITLQPLFNSMYVGGAFSSFNGTHRLGFTRLYSNGTVDTTFLDTAYNQFAGLKRIYSYDSPAVYHLGF